MSSLNSFGSGGKTAWHSYGAFALASNLLDVCLIITNHYTVEALTSTLRSASFRSEAQETLLCIYGVVTELCELWELLLNTFCKRGVRDAPFVSAEIWSDTVEGQASDTGEL
jgi:hypothetical protein